MTDCTCPHTDAAHGPDGCKVIICPCAASNEENQ